MNGYRRASLILVFTLLAVQACFAKEWRGIAPLRSTRADVVRLFNQCSEQAEACAFSLAQEEVYILFSGGLQDKYEECAKRLAPETVIFIHILPKSQSKLNELQPDKKTLKKFDDSAPLGRDHKGFMTSDGLVIDTYRGRVLQLVYIADPKDVSLCPVYFNEPASFIHTLTVHPPLVLSLDCPMKVISSDKKVVLRASANVDSKRGPKWTVNAGRISAGQHTYMATLDTTGLAAGTILVSAEIGDGFGHLASASCEIVIEPK